MTDKLKPCPFCGSDDIDVRDLEWRFVQCEYCGAQTEGIDDRQDGERRAIARWNTRAEPSENKIEPRNLTQEAAFLTALAEHGLLASTGEVLVSGIPSIGVPAGGLTKALNAACSTARQQGFDAGREWAAQVAEKVAKDIHALPEEDGVMSLLLKEIRHGLAECAQRIAKGIRQGPKDDQKQ